MIDRDRSFDRQRNARCRLLGSGYDQMSISRLLCDQLQRVYAFLMSASTSLTDMFSGIGGAVISVVALQKAGLVSTLGTVVTIEVDEESRAVFRRRVRKEPRWRNTVVDTQGVGGKGMSSLWG
jgi:hypothetical protein